METFYSKKPKGKFVALFSDGSGAGLFWRLDDDENGMPVICDHDGDQIPEPETFLIDSGYSHWLPLPDDYKFWFELTP